jgi:branched-chain amino acid aminotransferase
MINFNGELYTKDTLNLPYNNRAFLYGDALFETLKYHNNSIEFFEDHYFRLMASMRMLRMEIPVFFSLDFLKNEILKTLKANNLLIARIRLQVFRKSGGLYMPKSNDINFLIETSVFSPSTRKRYEIDVFKDYQVFSGTLSNLKTTNRIINVISSIYANENNLDDCILLNEKKNVVETTKANIFLVKGNQVLTPSLTEGCIKGIMRKKVIEEINRIGMYELIETEISPFEIQKSEAVFITNSIIGIQPVTKYRKKLFNTSIVELVTENFNL